MLVTARWLVAPETLWIQVRNGKPPLVSFFSYTRRSISTFARGMGLYYNSPKGTCVVLVLTREGYGEYGSGSVQCALHAHVVSV